MGPVLRRWVAGSVKPVSRRLRGALEAILAGDQQAAATLLQSPVFGLPELPTGRTAHGALKDIARWALKDSPVGHDLATNLDDFVLGVLGTAIVKISTASETIPLTRVLMACAEVCRQTAQGQFVCQVQGAAAMAKVRKSGKESWRQTKSLDRVAELLGGQVRAALLASPADAGVTHRLSGREVVSVTTAGGLERRLELRPPEPDDWTLLRLTRLPKGDREGSVLGTWASFAMLVICAAQAEAGWFDLGVVQSGKLKISLRPRKSRHRPAHALVLSPAANRTIREDLERWMALGFTKEPMLAEPDDGDYLSVKHKRIAGGRGPKGMRTVADGTTHWEVASQVLAKTKWTVARETLRALREDETLRAQAGIGREATPERLRKETILNAYRALATDEFYIPIFADFRGRLYPQGHNVTYQGDDMQRGLLSFPDAPKTENFWGALVQHAGNLYGNGLDKQPYGPRYDLLDKVMHGEPADLAEIQAKAEKPIQWATLVGYLTSGQWDRIPCQIDGTCNGLQHLTALFRDEEAAPYVNLTPSSRDEAPADLYGRVAARLKDRLVAVGDSGVDGGAWARRCLSALKIDRKLTKHPVMVLPYGGTRTTIEEQVFAAILEQPEVQQHRGWWSNCLQASPDAEHGAYMDRWALDNGYLAFQDRDLKDHPLLKRDAKLLGGLLYECIQEVLPRPLQAMEAFRSIARFAKDQDMRWSTHYGDNPLIVVQAKSKAKAARLNLRGFQLPDSVRGLQIMEGSDEVDPLSHVTGIVANLIHSLDARHLVATMAEHYDCGGRTFAAVHDGFISRPSEMAILNKAVRAAFCNQYEQDPLSWPVWIGEKAYENWYVLAGTLGVEFPGKGRWEPREVLTSAWCFA